jgi:general secretion pathway protein C
LESLVTLRLPALAALNSESVHRWLGRALAAAIAAALLWYAAGLFWAVFAPAARHEATTPELAADVVAARVVTRHVFGEATTAAAAAAPVAAEPGTAITLRGVIAGTRRGKGYAIVSSDGQASATVAEGQEIRPGVRLDAVYPNRIEISRNGARETIALPARTARNTP